MNSQTFVFSTICALALTAGLVFAGTPALANQSDARPQSTTEQLTVVAPRIMRSKVYTAKNGVEGYQVLRLSRHVSYADLDLTRPADVKTLDKRIETAANRICAKLAKARPAVSKSYNCVNDAIQDGMQQANVAKSAAALLAAKG